MKSPSEPSSTPSSSACDPLKDWGTEVYGPSFALKHPLQILIAEDNYINRRVYMMFMRHLGYHADCVENGFECLNMALQGNYDLILTDVDMPEMNGIECTRELRKSGVKARIIAITGSSVENPCEQCMKAGMDGLLPKPFPPNELRNILRETHAMKIEKVEAHLSAS